MPIHLFLIPICENHLEIVKNYIQKRIQKYYSEMGTFVLSIHLTMHKISFQSQILIPAEAFNVESYGLFLFLSFSEIYFPLNAFCN